MMHDDLYEAALRAIQSLFQDDSVEPEETKISLQTLVDELEIMIEAID